MTGYIKYFENGGKKHVFSLALKKSKNLILILLGMAAY